MVRRSARRTRGWVWALAVVLWPAAVMGEPEVEELDDEGEVVVVTRAPVSGGVPSEAELGPEEIEALGPRSAQDLLRGLPGVHVSQHGSEGKAAQFFLRGVDAAHGTDVTLSVDGRPLNEGSHIHGHGYADAGLLIPEVLMGVELRRGVFGLDQGSFSTAGDVDFRLGVPEGRRGLLVGAEGGWPARGRAVGLWAPEDRREREFVAGELVWDGGPYENRETLRAGALGQVEVGGVRLRGGGQGARFGLPGALPLADLEAGRVERGESYSPSTVGETREVWVGAVREGAGPRARVRTSVDLRGRSFDATENFTGFLLNAVEGDDRREVQRSVGLRVEHRGEYFLTESVDGVVFAGGYGEVLDQFAEGVERERGGQGVQGGVFLAPGAAWVPREWLLLEAGVRLEAMGFGFQEDEVVGGARGQAVMGVVAPRGRVSVMPRDEVGLTAGLGRGYRAPEMRGITGGEELGTDEDHRFFRGGDGEITTVDAAEVGVSVTPWTWLELGVTGFGAWSQAEYVYDHVSRLNVDLGATRRLGVEAGASARGERFFVRGHATWVDARFVDGGELPFVPPVEIGLLAQGEVTEWLGLGAHVRGVSERSLPFGARAAGYGLVDVHVRGRYEGWGAVFRVENLLGAEWEEGVYHYASRFDLVAPASSLPAVHVVPGAPRGIRLEVSHRW